ncbi:MAG: glycosyltransferase family 2 protein [Candidatus Binatia bacterium]
MTEWSSEKPMDPRFSIVIPSWNDARSLSKTLDCLQGLTGIKDAEIIVAAFGDNSSVEQAAAGRARVLWPGQSTRAAHMNSGAAVAHGEILFFLHADSFPPVNALELIDGALSDACVVGGAFEHLFADPAWSLRMITWINRIRYRLTRNYYGDQGIFVRTSVFRHMGGYKELQILEDLEFSQRLKGVGQTVLVKVPMLTSGRRFLSQAP